MLTHPANALAEMLEIDRSTMLKALRSTQPDLVKKGNRPTWRIGTASKALMVYKQKLVDEKRRKEGGNGGSLTRRQQLANQLEADFEAFDIVYARLKAEPNLQRRRKLDEELGAGKMFGGLDRLARESNATLGEGEDSLFNYVWDHLFGDMISEYLTLIDLWPSDAEMAKLKAEGEARRPGQ
jgi:hypothetical protein